MRNNDIPPFLSLLPFFLPFFFLQTPAFPPEVTAVVNVSSILPRTNLQMRFLSRALSRSASSIDDEYPWIHSLSKERIIFQKVTYLFIFFSFLETRHFRTPFFLSLSLSFIISSPPFLFFAFFFLSLFLVVQPYFSFLCLIEESAEAEF